jgi:DNA-binding transcriptional LysR family regulator
MQETGGPRLEQIEAFAAVAEHGGFAAAAKVLGRDPSIVSRRVSALEARLGVRLLARTTRRVVLTEAGAAYLSRVQAILAELASVDIEAAEGAAQPRGLLRVALPATFSRLWVTPWLPHFFSVYPGLRVELLHGDRFVHLVAEGIDVAVRIGALEDSSLLVRRLAPVKIVLCASPDYLARHGAPETPHDLQRHACLGLTIPHLWPDWSLRRGDERTTVRVDGALLTDDGATMVLACLHGAGIMLASDWAVGHELAAGRLVQVLPEWEYDRQSAVHIVLPPGRFVPAKSRAFVERLVAEFTPKPPWQLLHKRARP